MSILSAAGAACAIAATIAGSAGALLLRDNPSCPFVAGSNSGPLCNGADCAARVAPYCANHSEQNKISCHFGDIADGLRHFGTDPYAPADPEPILSYRGPSCPSGWSPEVSSSGQWHCEQSI